jgi:hypothetical protein
MYKIVDVTGTCTCAALHLLIPMFRTIIILKYTSSFNLALVSSYVSPSYIHHTIMYNDSSYNIRQLGNGAKWVGFFRNACVAA